MKKSILALTLLSTLFTLSAQQAGFGLVFGIPRNEFREATKAEGYGFDLTALFPVGGEVINFGGSINYQIYGLNAQNKDLFAEITAGGSVIGTIEIPLRVVNTSSIFGMHGILRVTAPTEAVRPYMEGLVGFRYISTTTRIEDRDDFWNDDEDNVLVRRTNLAHWIFSYGGGGGIQFNIGQDVYLDLRAYYLLGGKANYYDGNDTKKWEVEFSGTAYNPNDVDPDDFSISAQPKNSRTDMLIAQLGLTFKF